MAQAQDKIGDRLIMESKYEDMQEKMQKFDLSEMDSPGEYFTWCN